MSANGNENLKVRLEAAALSNQEKEAAAERAKLESSETKNKKIGQAAQPSIKLTMDFSKFASAND